MLFRQQVAEFLNRYFSDICIRKCYENQLSACCSKDGIITFFADMVINALNSSKVGLDRLEHAVKNPADAAKCIYLSEHQWNALKDLKKSFTWPDRPVLFESLERFFMDRGCDSPLMYMHKSPGLVSIRRVRDGDPDKK
jgi:hypothetical protein